MLSGIALLVGAFLIYNAVSVSVVRRRSDIGIMRALGREPRCGHGVHFFWRLGCSAP